MSKVSRMKLTFKVVERQRAHCFCEQEKPLDRIFHLQLPTFSLVLTPTVQTCTCGSAKSEMLNCLICSDVDEGVSVLYVSYFADHGTRRPVLERERKDEIE